MAVSAKTPSLHQVEELLSAVRHGKPFEDEDLRFLLSLTDPKLFGKLFQAACEVRDTHFGSKVFLYGFVYFSTFCRNDCTFCQYRRDNRMLPRHRRTSAEILASSKMLADAGVHLIDLTMGEDPHFISEGTDGAGFLMESLQEVKKSTGLPLMVSPGVVSSELLNRLARSGADWYACYQETHTRSLFAKMRPGQSFDARWEAKLSARRSGMLIEEGLLSGVGETIEDIIVSFAMIRRLDPDQIRVMTFVPQPGTPMANIPPPDSLRELLIIAMLRLAFPDRLIPASLDVEGLNGLQRRLNAGANVVTSLIAPGSGLTGVASVTRDIENSQRMPSAVCSVVDRCGLAPAERGDYPAWMQRRWRAINSGESG